MRRLNRIPHVDSIRIVRPHTIDVHFDDGLVRTLEFIRGQEGEWLRPLDDPHYFAGAFLNHGTIAWPNGLDLDPVVLHGDREPVSAPLFREVVTAAEP